MLAAWFLAVVAAVVTVAAAAHVVGEVHQGCVESFRDFQVGRLGEADAHRRWCLQQGDEENLAARGRKDRQDQPKRQHIIKTPILLMRRKWGKTYVHVRISMTHDGWWYHRTIILVDTEWVWHPIKCLLVLSITTGRMVDAWQGGHFPKSLAGCTIEEIRAILTTWPKFPPT